jgi:hypothetical protein
MSPILQHNVGELPIVVWEEGDSKIRAKTCVKILATDLNVNLMQMVTLEMELQQIVEIELVVKMTNIQHNRH